MSVPLSAAVAMGTLGAAGCLPVVALVGFRWFALPLCPLGGALLAAAATICCVGIGATTMTWFVAVSMAAALGSVTWWWRRPDRRPWAESGGPRVPGVPGVPGVDGVPGQRATGMAGFVGVVGACGWCLRALATPTIGFDARAIWLLRAGWFLQPHHRLIVDMSSPGIILPQTSYPPLVSSAGSVAWFVSGTHTMRLGVVVIALLNTCALAVAALAVVECGRQASRRLWAAASDPGTVPDGAEVRSAHRRPTLVLVPSLVGVAGAVGLVFVTFGVTEPFMTNGYADPLWSIAAVGAVAYGLQSTSSRSALGAAAILVLVAGLSKEEGAATAVLLVGLLTLRRLLGLVREGRKGRWWRPVVLGVVGLAVIGAWPETVRLRHLRDPTTGGSSPPGAYVHRAHEAIDGLAPYLHVLLLAVPVALVGAVMLRPVRRAVGIGNDGWGWTALVAGSAVILGAFVTGTVSVALWLPSTAYRVTDYTALSAWWIVALWAVTGSAAPSFRPRSAGPVPEPVPQPVPEPVGADGA